MSEQMEMTLIQRQAKRIAELEQELQITRRQLDQFQGRQMDEIAQRRRSALQFYREQYELKHGAETWYSKQRDGDGYDELDS